jgi:fluoride exporter
MLAWGLMTPAAVYAVGACLGHRGVAFLLPAAPIATRLPAVPGSLRQEDCLRLYLWIALGSALGGVARFWCTDVMARLMGATFPWGTLFVNVLGSLIIGFFATITAPDARLFVDSTTRQFVMIGFLGGYTTFSSFSLQTLNLVNDGEWLYAGLNIGASVVLCLLAVWLGHLLAVHLNAIKWV